MESGKSTTSSRMQPNTEYQQSTQNLFSNQRGQIFQQQQKQRQPTQQKLQKPKLQTYSSIYSKVFHNRMKFYYRLSAILAFLITIVVTFPFKTNIIFFPVKFLLIWSGFIIFELGRASTITTVSMSTSNYIQKVVALFTVKKTYVLFSSIMINSSIILLILYAQADSSLTYYIATPTKTIKPFVNDNFAFFLFFMISSTIFYSWKYIVNERFILQTPIGTFREEPIEYLKSLTYLKGLVSSLIRAVFSLLAIPLLYQFFFRNVFFKVFLKPLVFFCDLNQQLPRSDISITTTVMAAFYAWLIFFSIDFLNELFNAYALVGCLVVDKPISFHSETPFQTLLHGIKDYKNPLVRLTAYQELAYLSTSPDFKDRLAFYDLNNWTLLLTEFYFVLNTSAKSARSDLPKRNRIDALKSEKLNYMKKNISLFGNLNKYENNLDFEFNFEISDDKKDDKIKEKPDTTIFSKENEAIFEKPAISQKLTAFEESYNKVAYAVFNRIHKTFQKFETYIKKYFEVEDINELKETDSATYQLYVVLNDVAELFKTVIFGTIEEQSNKRLPNKEIVGFAIISLTELLIHSKTEDKNHIVTDSLTESLTLLTKVYKGTSEFLNNPPVKINNQKFSILIINELTISYFFKLVIFYNSSMKDLLLPPEVFKLSKWCTDMALEQQKEQSHADILR